LASNLARRRQNLQILHLPTLFQKVHRVTADQGKQLRRHSHPRHQMKNARPDAATLPARIFQDLQRGQLARRHVLGCGVVASGSLFVFYGLCQMGLPLSGYPAATW
jgi:hypothetical protein